MHKTSAQNAHKTAQSPAHNPPLPRRGRGCVHGVVQALGTVHSETAREATRRALEKASPGLLAFLDLAKAKFPASRLVGLSVQDEQGQWKGQGELKDAR